MRATIEQVNRYKITIGGKTYDDFIKVGEWEDFIKFKGKAGTVIVDGSVGDCSCFFLSVPGQPVELGILKMSPGLVPVGELETDD